MRCHKSQRHRRSGIILPLALLVIGLLAVLAAQVVFRANADVAAVQATEAALQARLAAEAGIQKAMAVLQTSRADMDAWYNNPDAFYARIVQGATSSGPSSIRVERPSDKPDAKNPWTWRFSVVSDHPGGLNGTPICRYGLTDEAAKLNINTISESNRDELERLIRLLVHDPQVNVDELVDSLIDWRDDDSDPLPNGAEDEYYLALDSPYQPRNANFNSVEELLLVRAWTGQILFGEDWNRNGILDAAENDGDASFPPDNGDAQLDRGLWPFLTVWSAEPNTNSQNRPKIHVNFGNSEMQAVTTQLTAYGLTTDQIAAISYVKQQPGGLRTPLDLLLKAQEEAELAFGVEDLPLLLDLFTTSKAQTLRGLINVNTASPEVLQAVGFTGEEARRIVSIRGPLSPDDKSSLAWLVTQGAADLERLGEPALFNRLTVRSFQFHVESIGFADHVGTFCRLQTIITMNGPVPQISYWRDLSSLGLARPVRGQEGTNVVVSG